MVYQLGKEVIQGTPLENVSYSAFRYLNGVANNKSLRNEGIYNISPPVAQFGDFKMYLPYPDVDLLRGVYEVEILEEVVGRVTPNTTFWEVGARWGYFSLSAASVADDVRAFEALSGRADRVRKSVEANGYDNMSVTDGVVGEDVHLEEYPPADLITMDIEGYEYPVLQSELASLDHRPTWIVELHDFTAVDHKPEEVSHDPAKVEELFCSEGYELEYLSRRADRNYHILATA